MSDRRQKLVGKRYGRGVVTRKLGQDKYNCYVWELLCSCGNTYKATTGNLNAGHVTSCGCYSLEVVTKNVKKAAIARALPKGQAAKNELLLTYKRRAESRNLPFELTNDEFLAMTQMPCTYCGQLPSNVWRFKVNGDSEYIYNGIDRIDSNKGYTKENTQPCCKRCNQGKNDMTEQEFLSWIAVVYDFSVMTQPFVLKEQEVEYGA